MKRYVTPIAGLTLLTLAILTLTYVFGPANPGDGTNPLLSATWESRKLAGRIEARKQAGSYTYLLVDTGDAQTWTVIAEPLDRGAQDVRLQLYARLGRFTSRHLNYTFEPLHFATVLPKETR